MMVVVVEATALDSSGGSGGGGGGDDDSDDDGGDGGGDGGDGAGGKGGQLCVPPPSTHATSLRHLHHREPHRNHLPTYPPTSVYCERETSSKSSPTTAWALKSGALSRTMRPEAEAARARRLTSFIIIVIRGGRLETAVGREGGRGARVWARVSGGGG